ncbi:ABC transporter substrate-binding protein [Dyadobacter arcticus]|uniref:Iron complex transport system substrate-binding protein n=1 Tax=Dyadobacter arcticus TaxID=1078754 RepID=A0ABX0UQS2_9BACT|nr:ABC transporter substrate-binding protein [Dyadobacter arcticus]NIJ55312.1 iron complex transport system substrate-binding protein [Dyadobacter arcticus]
MLKQFFLISLSLSIFGCNTKKSTKTEEKRTTEASDYQNQVQIKHAQGFTIEYFKDYKIASIISPADTLKYILLEKGTPRPKGYPNAQIVEIPVKSAVAMSSMHIGLFEFLVSENTLTGLGNLQYVYSPSVITQIKAGKIVEVGRDQGLNEEKLIEMHPGVVITVGSPGTKSDHYQILTQAEIPVLVNSEWIEKTPLARAEWVKLIAALLNKEKLVNEKFGKLESEYNRLAALAAGSKEKPTLISGLNTKDAWFLPSGDSYMSKFFQDAGADYHWKDKKAEGSLPLNFEAVYPFALDADYWVNVGFSKSDTKKDILSQDSRYSDFKAFKSGKMYSYNAKVNDMGSNDFFESGTVNPHIVLADLIKIFHPEILPEHRLVYYKQLQ